MTQGTPNHPDEGRAATSNALRLRAIPAVHALADAPGLSTWKARVPTGSIMDAARQVLEDVRAATAGGPHLDVAPTTAELARRVNRLLEARNRSAVRPLINATGIILHTGLGRAPLAASASSALSDVAGRYGSVEIDLKSGNRGDRLTVVSERLARLTGADGAVVVNNNAAATLLALVVVTSGEADATNQVIVSRGELIEIGGSFRLPNIMSAGGTVLREVGTTNKTHLTDYEEAIGPGTAALMKVHTSNYRVVGFTESVAIDDLVRLGRARGVPVIHDIGSGALQAGTATGLKEEPAAATSICAGADMVLFSGDKLLGGPQSGIIVGTSAWIDRLRRHPLMRALRVDKLTLAALDATLKLHEDPARAARELPVAAFMNTTLDQLEARGGRIVEALRTLQGLDIVETVKSEARLGGGSLPTQGIESVAIRLRAKAVNETELAARLRVVADPPVIGRVQDGSVWLDLRTVFPDEDDMLIAAVKMALQSNGREECR